MNDLPENLIRAAKQVTLTDAEKASIRAKIAGVVADAPVKPTSPVPVKSPFFGLPFMPYLAPLAILVFVGVYYASTPGTSKYTVPVSNDISPKVIEVQSVPPDQMVPIMAPAIETRELKTMQVNQASIEDTGPTPTEVQKNTPSTDGSATNIASSTPSGTFIENRTRLP